VALVRAPAGFEDLLDGLPAEVKVSRRLGPEADFMVRFDKGRAPLAAALPRARSTTRSAP
jgi:hypothetical protein